ncbi:MAG: hypothetical protein ACAI18_12725 [Gemmatimonadales bacterium]
MRSSLFLAFAFWAFTWGAFLGKAVRAHGQPGLALIHTSYGASPITEPGDTASRALSN